MVKSTLGSFKVLQAIAFKDNYSMSISFYEQNIGVHFYTSNEAEKMFVEENLSNYNYEGIAYYAFSLANS
jgi:hypothetical protein